MWFKEYTFNIIIQPFHLLIYTVLVGSAMELAQTHLVYAVVAIYFVIPAEKLLRKFFGFDNAGTLSAAGSFAGGAVFSAMISKLNRPKPKDGKDGEEKPKNLRKNSSSGTVDADNVLSRTKRLAEPVAQEVVAQLADLLVEALVDGPSAGRSWWSRWRKRTNTIRIKRRSTSRWKIRSSKEKR